MRKESAYNTDLFLLYLQTGSREQRLAQAVMQGEEYTSTRKHDGCCACVPVFALFGNKQCFLWKIRDKGKREDFYHVISDLQRSSKIRGGNSAGAYKF